ncbi:RHS repeat protein [Vibrio sagamiensis]|uniref:Sugar-binding protein n=1 Tax=Vibrio sagamiensis NBRC 104589 TaxID=1219064 RepID=A0A511QIP4_9VIBR|nr:RHS repeat protein [Vibrio sagamiensis]PNQ63307.1 RHS repeat protein [Vibrio agarivorans]GEM76976.1 sugar-binding protein [Vibrio sagamiensis NBRC 104589]
MDSIYEKENSQISSNTKYQQSPGVESVLSYASNVDRIFGGDVNHQTGTYIFQISLLDIVANSQKGPNLQLNLSLNQKSRSDTGFSRGMEANLTHLDTGNELLRLSSGEAVKVDLLGVKAGEIVPLSDARITDFKLVKINEERFEVYYKSGEVETLVKHSNVDDVAWIKYKDATADKGKLYLVFEYDRYTQQLKSIKDKQGFFYFSRQDHPQYDYAFDLMQGRRVMHVLSTSDGVQFSKPDKPSAAKLWTKVFYSARNLPTQISSIDYFYGRRDTLTYQGTLLKCPTGEMGVPGMPVVEQMDVTDLNQEEALLTRTRYSYGEKNDNNYLGYNGKSFTNEGMTAYSDYMCNLKGNYFYAVTVTEKSLGKEPDRITTFKYDKYHNMVESKMESGGCVQSTTLAYHLVDYGYDVPFNEQDKRCRLPRLQTITYQDAEGSRSETTEYNFDDYGNPLLEHDLQTGLRSEFQYYDTTDGSIKGCPAYTFVHFVMRQRRWHPLERLANTISYTYKLLPNATNTVAIETKTFHEAAQQDTYSFNDDGTLKQQKTSLNGYVSIIDHTYDYTYSTDECSECFAHTITLSASDLSGESHTQFNVLDALTGNRLILTQQGSTLENVFYPDGRLYTETADKGGEYEAVKTYVYEDALHQSSVTDPNGNILATIYDARSRLRESLVTVIDWSLNEHVVETRQYNGLGQVISGTQYDVVADNDPTFAEQSTLTLSMSAVYDGWGNPTVNHQDGRQEVKYQNPVSQRSYQAVVGMPYQVIVLSEDKRTQTRTDCKPDGTVLAQDIQRMDTFERVKVRTDKYGLRTDMCYDVFDRVITENRPGQYIQYSYSPYSSEALVIDIALNRKSLGMQKYDPFGRLLMTSVGGRDTHYRYPAGSLYSDQRTLANGTIQPLSFISGAKAYESAGSYSYTYDPNLAICTSAEKDGVETQITYRFDSLPDTEISNGHTTQYFYSLLGKPTAIVSSTGIKQTTLYDAQGRIDSEKVHNNNNLLCETLYEDYDDCGRPGRITTTREGQTLTRTTDWDEFPSRLYHEADLSTGEMLTEAVTFYDNGLIHKRAYTLGNQSLDESFIYDEFSRLTYWQGKGSMAPVDDKGRKLSEQFFEYDSFNNLTKLTSFYINSEDEIRTLHYNNPDPCQLSLIDVQIGQDIQTWFIPEYDDFGNMLNDEKNSTYTYDVSGLIESVTPQSGGKIQYRYDGLGRLDQIQPDDQSTLIRRYAGQSLLVEQQGDYLRHYQRHADGGIVGKTLLNAGEIHQHTWYQNNAKGSPLRVSGSDSFTQDYSYSAFGIQSVITTPSDK